ncbi:MAG: LVIVD repeat-containing protein [Dehalococcoidia bacterium]
MNGDAPQTEQAKGLAVVGYHDLENRPGFKMGMQVVNDRWYLYMGSLWHRGWSILDVTDPARPQLANWVEGPDNTWTIQMQVADGLMVTALERISPVWGGDPNRPHEAGVYIWDVSDPVHPRRLSYFATGGGGTHRNFYAGGPYLHLAANPEGYQSNIYIIVDISDPENPREVSRWWYPGQHKAGGEAPTINFGLHGPAHVEGDRAYLSYGDAGMVILDVSDLEQPTLVSRLPFKPPLGSNIPVHSVVPIRNRTLALINSEALAEECQEPLNFAAVVDISNEREPRLISLLPLPVPEPGLPYANFCQKGGRFGPHNQQHWQGQPHLLHDENKVYLTYFNAGLRIYDIADPLLPSEVAYYVPENPKRRNGLLPRTLVTQTEDVLVDVRGYIYMTDKNHGLIVLRETA